MARSCNPRAIAGTSIALAAGVLFLFSPRVASGQVPDDAAEAEAAQHHERGVELFRAGSYAEAVSEFERAQELSPSRTNLWNLARCHEQLGQLDVALRYLDEYLSEPELPQERRQEAVAYRSEIADRVSTSPEAEASPVGPTVSDSSQTAGAASVAEQPQVAEPGRRSVAGPWALIGSGLAVVVAGFALDIAAYSSANRDANDRFSTIEDYRDWQDGYEAMALAGDILVPVGAAASLGGLLWLLLQGRRQPEANRDNGLAFEVMSGGAASAGLRMRY